MIGVHEPLAAIQDAVNLHGFDELIISTLPDAGLEVAQARPAAQGGRPRPAGHDRDGQGGRADRGACVACGVSPFWIWVQVAIIVCVLISAVIAVIKLV